MSKYEYKIIILSLFDKKKEKKKPMFRRLRELKHSDIERWEEKLNELGKEGWELIEAVPMAAQLGLVGSTPQVRCFLKRKI